MYYRNIFDILNYERRVSIMTLLKWIVVIESLFIFVDPIHAKPVSDSLVSPPKKKSATIAIFKSALLPGWGQWYNEQKLKAIIVFGGELVLMTNVMYFNQKVQASQTSGEKIFYEENRSRYVWWFFGVYLLNLLDAYVDAHLWDFEIGPDLSFSNMLSLETPFMFRLKWDF